MNVKTNFSYLSFFVLCVFLAYARSGITKDAFLSLRNRPAVSRSAFPLLRRQLSNSSPPAKNEDAVFPKPADTQPNNGGTSGNGDANKKPNETVPKPATASPKPVFPSETGKPLDPVPPTTPVTPISTLTPVTPKPAAAPVKRPTALVPPGDAATADTVPTLPKEEDPNAAKPAAKPESNTASDPAAAPAATSPNGANMVVRENRKSVPPLEKQSSSTLVILLSIGAASIVIVIGIVWGVRKYKLNPSAQFQSRLDPHQDIFAPNHHGFHTQPPSVLPSPAIVPPIAPRTFTLPRTHRPPSLESSSSAPSPPRPPLSA